MRQALSAVLRIIRLGRPWWATLALAFGCMVVVGLSTGALALLTGPSLELLLSPGGASLLPGLAPEHAVAVLLLLVGVVKGVAYLGQFFLVGRFGQRVTQVLRRQLLEHLLTLSPARLSRERLGDLLSRFSQDVAQVELAATYTVASWLRDSVQLLVLCAVALSLSWKLSLLAVVAVPLAVVPASALTRRLLAFTREGQRALGALAAQMHEGLTALTTVQAYGAQAAERARFHRQALVLETAAGRAGWAASAVPGVMEVLGALAIASTLVWMQRAPPAEPGALVSFLATVVLLYQPAKDLGRLSQFALAAHGAFQRLDEVLGPGPPPTFARGDELPLPVQEGLRFRGVSFDWGDGRPVLQDASFWFPAGQVTALTGPSGVGKSTVVKLLLGFENPTGGRIELDGVDLATVPLARRRATFALVTQEPLLLDASVRDNLLLARAGASAAEVEAACRLAQAWDFVEALPEGLDTRLGERAQRLSGGQKQRLCLARAVLSGAPVLVLDEATSQLDARGEAEVAQALAQVLPGRTALVVAHGGLALRLASAEVVLNGGASPSTAAVELSGPGQR